MLGFSFFSPPLRFFMYLYTLSKYMSVTDVGHGTPFLFAKTKQSFIYMTIGLVSMTGDNLKYWKSKKAHDFL